MCNIRSNPKLLWLNLVDIHFRAIYGMHIMRAILRYPMDIIFNRKTKGKSSKKGGMYLGKDLKCSGKGRKLQMGSLSF